MPYIPGTNIKVVGGTITHVKGDLTKIDNSRHQTDIDSFNIRGNKMIDSFNSNSKIIDDQRRENYTGPHPSHPQSQFMPHQSSSSGRSRIENHDFFNMEKNRINDAFNDYSETHYDGWAPPINQRAKARPQNPQPNSMPSHIQQFGQRMYQALSDSKTSEENAVPNHMPRNNDEDEDNDDPSSTSRDTSHPHLATHPRPDPTFPTMQVDRPVGNSNPSNLGPNDYAYSRFYSNPSEKNYPSNPPPVSTPSSGPIIRTINGNLTQHDNSVRQTNISSHNVEDNELINSFNYNPKWKKPEENNNQLVISGRK